jgi:hypothetical protein
VYVFPATLPDTLLRPEQIREQYGLNRAVASRLTKRQVQKFLEWATAPLNLQRGTRYAPAIQSATAVSNENNLYAFFGYCQRYFPLRVSSMLAYLDPEMIISFVAYLRARGTKKGHILKHVSLARKVSLVPEGVCGGPP